MPFVYKIYVENDTIIKTSVEAWPDETVREWESRGAVVEETWVPPRTSMDLYNGQDWSWYDGGAGIDTSPK